MGESVHDVRIADFLECRRIYSERGHGQFPDDGTGARVDGGVGSISFNLKPEYLNIVQSTGCLDSKKTELLTALLREEEQREVLQVFSETGMWRGEGENGYFEGTPTWSDLAAALQLKFTPPQIQQNPANLHR